MLPQLRGVEFDTETVSLAAPFLVKSKLNCTHKCE